MTMILVYLGIIFTKYTIILPIYGARKYVLRGSYLPIFFMARLFVFFEFKLRSLRTNAIVSPISLSLIIIYMIKMCNSIRDMIKYINGILDVWILNPPGIMVFLYIMLTFTVD